MNLENIILDAAKSQKRIQTSDVKKITQGKISRQYITRIFKKLITKGQLVRFGAGAGTFYTLPTNVMSLNNELTKKLKNENLKEHEIYFDFEKQLHLKEILKENVHSIFTYAFSEMLNNAIEHSQSDEIKITYSDNTEQISFLIRDYGIGAFKNVMKKHSLKSEIEAIQDILKGKITTNPETHTGQGIFFTSKVADLFILESYGYRLRIDNTIPDLFIEELSPLMKGTRVTFTLSANSKKHLNDVFKEYQTDPEGYDFDKTKILIKLFTMGTVYVSRSQGRRIMAGLEKYKYIVLDFDKVPTIGQAFSDEIFRVFKTRYPDIKIEPIHMSETVEFMIKRVNT